MGSGNLFNVNSLLEETGQMQLRVKGSSNRMRYQLEEPILG